MIIEKQLTPMKAIRKKCLECCCGQANEVALCHIKDCALWAYRSGHKPTEMPTYTVEIDDVRYEKLRNTDMAAIRSSRGSKNSV